MSCGLSKMDIIWKDNSTKRRNLLIVSLPLMIFLTQMGRNKYKGYIFRLLIAQWSDHDNLLLHIEKEENVICMASTSFFKIQL